MDTFVEGKGLWTDDLRSVLSRRERSAARRPTHAGAGRAACMRREYDTFVGRGSGAAGHAQRKRDRRERGATTRVLSSTVTGGGGWVRDEKADPAAGSVRLVSPVPACLLTVLVRSTHARAHAISHLRRDLCSPRFWTEPRCGGCCLRSSRRPHARFGYRGRWIVRR